MIFKEIRKLIRGRQGGRESLLRALSRILSASELKALTLYCSDWRELPDYSCAEFNIKREKLAQKLSKRMGVAYCAEPQPVRIKNSPFNLQKLEATGAIPLVQDGVITGLAAVDPSRINQLGSEIEGIPCLFAYWSRIKEALYGSSLGQSFSERDPVEEVSKSTANELIDDDLLESVLVLLIKEVESFGQSRVVLHFGETGIRYEFFSDTGETARGRINQTIRDALQGLIREAGVQSASLKVNQEGIIRDIRVELLPGRECKALLSWQSESVKTIILSGMPGSGKKAGRDEDNSEKLSSDVQSSKVKRVMVVDDNETFSIVLERFFKRRGLEVIRENSCSGAFARLKSGAALPDIIVCDVHLPEKNGIEFLNEVRAKQAFADMPFVMLTSDDDSETEVKALKEGADAFITKDADPRILTAHVERLLQKEERNNKTLKTA